MADQQHLDMLRQGAKIWNEWRKNNADVIPDLSSAHLAERDLKGADLSSANFNEADLNGADLSNANLIGAAFNEANLSNANFSKANATRAYLESANLSKACLTEANFSLTYLPGSNLRGANLNKARFEASKLYYVDLSTACLSQANFNEADFWKSDMSKAKLYASSFIKASFIDTSLKGVDLREANLGGTDLRGADLRGADLKGASLFSADLTDTNLSDADLNSVNLSYTRLIRTNLPAAVINNCRVYGTSVWDIKVQDTQQENLIIMPEHEPSITVDNIKVAQFIYTLLNNKEIRDVINTITTKTVLILGRFTPKQKKVLDTLRNALRRYNYLPILFDFEKPMKHSFTETVRTLAHLSHFIITDLTNPSSVPQELQAIAPTLAVPIQPILLEGKKDYSMFKDFTRYHWVLPIYYYKDQADLIASLEEYVIRPAEQKARELQRF